jgi:hypothetical protein
VRSDILLETEAKARLLLQIDLDIHWPLCEAHLFRYVCKAVVEPLDAHLEVRIHQLRTQLDDLRDRKSLL